MANRKISTVGRQLGDPKQLILLAIIRLGPDVCSMDIHREIQERGRRSLALAGVYAALQTLEADKLVTREEEGIGHSRRGRPTQYLYTITKLGAKLLQESIDSLIDMAYKCMPMPTVVIPQLNSIKQ